MRSFSGLVAAILRGESLLLIVRAHNSTVHHESILLWGRKAAYEWNKYMGLTQEAKNLDDLCPHRVFTYVLARSESNF